MARNPLLAAYLQDDARRASLNTQRRNYWSAYLPEIFDRLGVTAEAIAPPTLADPQALARFAVICLGDADARDLPDAALPNLERWVRLGGVLIAYNLSGADDIFGNETPRVVEQGEDEFRISGYLELARRRLTQGVHSPVHPRQHLLAISPLRPVRPKESVAIARYCAAGKRAPLNGAAATATDRALITARRLGRGWAFYFGFDFAQTMWCLHQGRPVEADHDGDGYLRCGDAIVIGDNDTEVAYSDELLFLLQSMIGRLPVPMVHRIPPQEGQVADLLLYFGGDDECMPEVQLPASEFMKSRGLPYHINIMPLKGRFAVSPAEFRALEANGHEPSLHYNFMDGFNHPTGFTQRQVLAQAALFRRHFGRAPVCTVNHWCRWTGWAEPARWMLAAGGQADNSHIHHGSPPLNPVNLIGFAFGTAFPYHFWDDWRAGNRRLPFLEEPIVAYEVGYGTDGTDLPSLRRALRLAAHYHLTMDFFYHPVYIARVEPCRRAIDEMLRYLEEQGLIAAFMGNDELARWWSARSQARIEAAGFEGDALRFEAECDYRGGFVVKAPIGSATVAECRCGRRLAQCRLVSEFGQNWALIPLDPGRHHLSLRLAAGP
jgi:hypothetical protein